MQNETVSHNVFIENQIRREYDKLKNPNWNSENKYSRNICLEAEIRYLTNERNRKKEWERKIEIFKFDNILFSRCKSLNGISKNAFLKRFLEFRPISNIEKKNCETMLTLHCNQIKPDIVLQNNISKSISSLHTICCICTTLEWSNQIKEWLIINAEVLWDNLCGCLLLTDHFMLFEVCIVIAFLMYKIPNQSPNYMVNLFHNLSIITSSCCKEFNDILNSHNTTKPFEYFQEDQLIINPLPIEIHNTDFILLSASVYCQTFLINYNFKEEILIKLINLYEQALVMERTIYLDLLYVIVEKLKKNLEIPDLKLVRIAEKFLEKLATISLEIHKSNRQRFLELLYILRNIVISKVPNYLVKLKRQTSLAENLFILSKKNKIRNSVSEIISNLISEGETDR